MVIAILISKSNLLQVILEIEYTDLDLASVVNWAFPRIKLDQYAFLKLPQDWKMPIFWVSMQMETIVQHYLVSPSSLVKTNAIL